MGGVNLQVYGGTALSDGVIADRREQRPADALIATLRDDVQLLQPCRLAPVLQGPGKGQIGNPNDYPPHHRHEQASPLGTIEDSLNRSGDLCGLDRNPMLMKLGKQEVYYGFLISRRRWTEYY